MTTSIAEHVDELARELLDQHPSHGAPATVDLDDGRALRLKVEPDDWPTLDLLEDCYGTLTAAEAYRGDRDYHRYPTSWVYSGHDRPRPDGFDGNAEKLHVRGDGYWWQPPADGPKRGTPEFAAMRRHLMSLLEEGFSVLTVEVLSDEDDRDAYGRPIVRGAATVGGVDLVWSTVEEWEHQAEYAREIVRGLIIDALADADEEGY